MIAEEYKNRYYINDISLFDEWGVIIEKGGYDELMKEPQRKQGYTHVWLDQNGTERFVEPYFESKEVNLSFVFLCENLADYLVKQESLFNLLKSKDPELDETGYITLSSTTLQKEWTLLYKGVSNVEELTSMYGDEIVIVRYNLTFVDDLSN